MVLNDGLLRNNIFIKWV